MSIIHVTGCDGVGKSTIVNELSKFLGFPTKHFDKPLNYEDGKKQYFDFAEMMNNNPDMNYICDRLHDGEWIYAPLYRGYKADYMREFEREIIKTHNYLLVYVKASLETIIERTRKRGEDFVKEEHFQTVLDSFEEYLKNQALPYIVIDTTNSKTEEDIKKIYVAYKQVNYIYDLIRNGQCSGAVMTPAMPRGNINGSIMIVGQNPGGRGKVNVKYSTTWCDVGLSEFMMNVTKEAGIFEDAWFTNLVPYPTPDNKVTEQQIDSTKDILRAQIELIQPKKIVTLGEIAYTTIKEKYGNRFEIVKLPHPAYVKRFFSGKPDKIQEYIESFKSLKE